MTEVIVKLTGSGDWEVPAGVTELANVLLVAGGGGGGRLGGGGGGGGVVQLSSFAVTPGELIAYSVGDGGAGATTTSVKGGNGQNTTFGAQTAAGGGGGGSQGNRDGNAGGSGGGGGSASAGAGNGGAGSQGNAGGNGTNASPFLCGGGGGFSAAGQNGATSGDGGAGLNASAIFGTTHGASGRFAGGGGGGRFTSGAAGVAVDGGGNGGADASGANGIAETGGGGGGGGFSSGGGSGGSGVILIRYVEPSTSTSTGTGTGSTGTGTGSTGAPQLLTPLNLFLVSMSLPDEPFEEPEPEPANPGGLSEIQLRLSADTDWLQDVANNDPVWLDQSGLGRDFSREQIGTGRPTAISSSDWGDRQVILFDDQYMTTRDNASNFVSDVSGLARNQAYVGLWFALRPIGTGTQDIFLINGSSTSTDVRMRVRIESGNIVVRGRRVSSDAESLHIIGPATAGTPMLFYAFMDFANGRLGGSINGAPLTDSALVSSGASEDINPLRVTLGYTRDHFGTSRLDAEVAEVFFSHGEPTEDIQTGEGYLAHKWGISSVLPSGHPFKSDPPSTNWPVS